MLSVFCTIYKCMTNDNQYKTSRILVRVTDNTHNEYKDYCDNNGFTISKRLSV